jgi:hypothetical protein
VRVERNVDLCLATEHLELLFTKPALHGLRTMNKGRRGSGELERLWGKGGQRS